MPVIRGKQASAAVRVLLLFSTAGIAAQSNEVVRGAASSNDDDRPASVLSETVRDGLVFWQLIQSLPQTDDSVVMIMSEMRLTADEAQDFLYLIGSTSRFIKNEENGVDQEIACRPGYDHTTDDKIYRTLERIFDEKAKVAERHLQIMKKDLGASMSQKLIDWLERRKVEAAIRRPNYRAVLERRGVSPGTVITRICNDQSGTKNN